MRLKLRWFVCQVLYFDAPGSGGGAAGAAAGAGAADAPELFHAVRAAVAELFGDVGAARAAAGGLAVRALQRTSGLAVVRCARDDAQRVHAALALVRALRRRPAAVRVLDVASSPRTLAGAAARWHAALAARVRASAAADGLLHAGEGGGGGGGGGGWGGGGGGGGGGASFGGAAGAAGEGAESVEALLEALRNEAAALEAV